MQHPKKGVMDVEKSKINLDMSFDVRDVIDILVSEQEQNIENQIMNLEFDLQNVKGKLKGKEKEIEDYIKDFVKEKYSEKINTVDSMFRDLGLDALVRFEIIDGHDMPSGRPRLMNNPQQQLEDREDRIVVALVITNKHFDRSTVDSTISFYLETPYDDELKELNKKRDEFSDEVKVIEKQINELEAQLSGTDRLVRRARAAVTKKAIGTDVSELLADFRKEFPQVGLKKNSEIELKKDKE